MTTYFVSRHPGAVEWARRHGILAHHVPHLAIESIQAGDAVLGTLPVHQVARINARGAQYLHLEFDMPESLRGRDLSADDMEQLGARLQEYRVERA